MAQGHGEGTNERARPVAEHALDRSLPRPAAQHPARKIPRLAHVIVGEQAKRENGAAGQPRRVAGNPEKPRRVIVDVQEIAEPVGDDDGNICLAEDHVRRKVCVESSLTPDCHARAPRPR